MPTATPANRLIDYPRFSARLSTGRRFKANPQGGFFGLEYCTPLGLTAVRLAREIYGRLPTFRGASKAGCYLKFDLSRLPAGTDESDLSVLLADRLRDEGIDVAVERTEGRRFSSETSVVGCYSASYVVLRLS